jgi:hypothetical protein
MGIEIKAFCENIVLIFADTVAERLTGLTSISKLFIVMTPYDCKMTDFTETMREVVS